MEAGGCKMPQLDLGKQIGPLPLGAWIVVVGGGLGIALYTRRMGQSSEPVIDTSPDPGVGEGGFQPTPPGTPVTEHPPTTNDEWATRAINYLIAHGYSPGLANSAITKALSGGAGMSVQEWSLWTTALLALGAPPTPVTVPPPSGSPGVPAPPVYKIVHRGQTVYQFLTYWALHWITINPKPTWLELVRLNPNVRTLFDPKTKKFYRDTALRIR